MSFSSTAQLLTGKRGKERLLTGVSFASLLRVCTSKVFRRGGRSGRACMGPAPPARSATLFGLDSCTQTLGALPPDRDTVATGHRGLFKFKLEM